MITTQEAKAYIETHIAKLPYQRKPLLQAAGCTLAQDVFAATDIPAYPQSSMDGYALHHASWIPGKPLKIIGEIAAGMPAGTVLQPGNAVRIFTGAALPPGADTVVMQEKVRVEDGHLLIDDGQLAAGANVRPKGSEAAAGKLAIAKGTFLLPAAVGFLAGIGIDEVLVYPKPAVGIIITGNELQPPGTPPEPGKVYESNSYMLQAALAQMHIKQVTLYYAKDTPAAVENALQQALDANDAVLLTGGVSVGDYDFVAGAAAKIGIIKVFHKIKQKPGKPLYFGMHGARPVFGLPGNPASVLTCFYEYVEPALQRLSNKHSDVAMHEARLSAPLEKKPGLTHFLKGFFDGETVTPLHAQESYRLASFANANCLIVLPESGSKFKAKQLVEIHLLPI